MRKALTITGLALMAAPLAAVAGYFGLQAYLDWLIAGAKRPLGAPGRQVGPHKGTTAPATGARGPGA